MKNSESRAKKEAVLLDVISSVSKGMGPARKIPTFAADSSKCCLLEYKTIFSTSTVWRAGPSREAPTLKLAGTVCFWFRCPQTKDNIVLNLCPYRPLVRRDGAQGNIRGDTSLPAPLTLSLGKL